jgi:aspartyl-tRNA(Asn)/glutamyl-tRNA(Gln) amidotransferase subunit B
MRFDVNVSVSPTEQLGTRTETKNLNSFKAVEKAIDYEINRQIELLEKGKPVLQETRGWDEAKQKTVSQRNKEEANDYRYFPEPDLPPIVIEADYIEKIRQELPIMPPAWRARLKKLGIDEAYIETLLDAEADTAEAGYLALIETAANDADKANFFAGWQVNIEIPIRKNSGKIATTDPKIKQHIFEEVYKMVKHSQLNSSRAKELLALLLTAEDIPENIEDLAKAKGFVQVSDESELSVVVKDILAANNTAVIDVKKGELQAIGFLVGQVMKATGGRANPELTQKIIRQQLGI